MSQEVRSNKDGQTVIDGVMTDVETEKAQVKINLKKINEIVDAHKENSHFIQALCMAATALDWLYDRNGLVGTVNIKTISGLAKQAKAKFKREQALNEAKTIEKIW